jgi:hypothetical protein
MVIGATEKNIDYLHLMFRSDDIATIMGSILENRRHA